MIALSEYSHVAGRAFDAIAEDYDELFTNSAIGRAQRAVVWERASALFPAGSRVLELNCGTGEDAMFLARKGIAVTACDASERMIEKASRRLTEDALGSVEFHLLPSERLQNFPSTDRFDGAFSNFSGLNCVSDLSWIAKQLAERLHAGSPVLLCLSTRFCAWEMLHYLAQGDLLRAFRRCSGFQRARLGAETIPVFYPTLRSIEKSFRPFFRLRSVTGVGICVPPSYIEGWASTHPGILRACKAVDSMVRDWRGIRVLGDHMLLHLERI